MNIYRENRNHFFYRLIIFFLLLIPFQNNLLSQLSDTTDENQLDEVRVYLSKGNQLTDIYPDSAIYYYQNALNCIIEKEDELVKYDLANSAAFYKVVLLNKIGFLFHMQSKYSIAHSYYQRGLDESILLGNDSLTAESEFSLAEILLENGSYVDAINRYTKAIKLFEKIEYPEGIFWANIGIGIIYRECGNTKLSKVHYENARNIALAQNDKALVGICNNNIGNLYRQVGEFKSAIEYLELALKCFEELGEERYISDVLEGIGDIYREYGDNDKSLEYYKRSTVIAESLGDNYRLFSRYSNLAKTYDALEESDKALMYLSKALKLAQSIGDKARMSEFLILISDFYKKNNDWKKARLNLDKSLVISREIGDTVSMASALTSLAGLYFSSKDYGRAFDFAKSALVIAQKRDLLKTIRDASYYLSKIEEKGNNFKNAYRYGVIYEAAKDSLLNAEKIKILEETEAKYNLEKLELEKLKVENAALTAEKVVQTQKILIGSLGILVIIGAAAFSRYFFKKKGERKTEKEKSIKLNRKIDLLNSQLNAKNRELTSKALLISNNNKILEEAVQSIDSYLSNEHHDKKELRKLKSRLQSIYEEESWEDFIRHFEDVHPNFYKTLTEKYSDLTSGELKICAFLRMNLNTKEISQITNQTTKSIEVARTRIRKKIGISHSDSLSKTIQAI